MTRKHTIVRAHSGKKSGPLKMGSGAMFDRIASRYDLLNRIMSLGLDKRWRRALVKALNLRGAARVLDLATGTADVALAIASRHPDASVVAEDPSERMLAQGRDKVWRSGVVGRVRLARGDAQAIKHRDNAFDAACMSFGIRNVPDRALALKEMCRVVRPGGRVGILELGEPRRGLLAPLARWHVRKLVPRLGAWLSGADAYAYLTSSVVAFPSPEVFSQMMRDAGFEAVRAQRLSFGAVHLYVGVVPAA